MLHVCNLLIISIGTCVQQQYQFENLINYQAMWGSEKWRTKLFPLFWFDDRLRRMRYVDILRDRKNWENFERIFVQNSAKIFHKIFKIIFQKGFAKLVVKVFKFFLNFKQFFDICNF